MPESYRLTIFVVSCLGRPLQCLEHVTKQWVYRNQKDVVPSPTANPTVPQRQWWPRQTPVPLRVAIQLDSPRKLQQPGVETPRRWRHSRLLEYFSGVSTTDCRVRGVQRHDTPGLATSSVATSGLLGRTGGTGRHADQTKTRSRSGVNADTLLPVLVNPSLRQTDAASCRLLEAPGARCQDVKTSHNVTTQIKDCLVFNDQSPFNGRA